MGTFFYLTAVRTSDQAQVERLLCEAVENQGHLTAVLEKPTHYEDFMAFAVQREAWTCVQYQQVGLDWCEVTRHLTARLKAPAFFFQIYDGDVWGYWFFDGGREIAKFVSMPSIYDEATDNPQAWQGNIREVAARLGMPDPSLLEKYLVHLDPEEIDSKKVHPEDSFELSDIWVISDFMDKLGIIWEDKEDKGKTIYIVKTTRGN